MGTHKQAGQVLAAHRTHHLDSVQSHHASEAWPHYVPAGCLWARAPGHTAIHHQPTTPHQNLSRSTAAMLLTGSENTIGTGRSSTNASSKTHQQTKHSRQLGCGLLQQQEIVSCCNTPLLLAPTPTPSAILSHTHTPKTNPPSTNAIVAGLPLPEHQRQHTVVGRSRLVHCMGR